MEEFSKEMLRFGTLEGFGYFSSYLRGREELMITIKKYPPTHLFEGSGILTPPTSRVPSGSRSNSGNATPLHSKPSSPAAAAFGPASTDTLKSWAKRRDSEGRLKSYVQNSELVPNPPAIIVPSPVSDGSQKGHWSSSLQSGATESPTSFAKHALQKQNTSVPMILAPASPANRDAPASQSSVVFLIGAYKRYKTPFVWLREGTLDGCERDRDRDLPLKLKSTAKWSETMKVSIWSIVSELVLMVVKPRPRNPLAINFTHLEEMSLMHSTFCTASLMQLLREVLVERAHSYDWLTLIDLQKLAGMHFLCFAAIAEDAVAPPLSDEPMHSTSGAAEMQLPPFVVNAPVASGAAQRHQGDSPLGIRPISSCGLVPRGGLSQYGAPGQVGGGFATPGSTARQMGLGVRQNPGQSLLRGPGQ